MKFNIFTLSKRAQEIEKLEKVAQDFINTNCDELIKAIHRYADVDKINDAQLAEYARDQQIFFLSGQTVANIFTKNRENTFTCYDYRDLDVFVLTANSISYDLKLEVNEEEYFESSNAQGVKTSNTLISVYDKSSAITLSTSSRNTNILPQFIEVANPYITLLQAKTFSNNMQIKMSDADLLYRGAYSVLDNFDLKSVKIGILVNRDLTHVTLIIHEDFLDNKYGLPIPATPSMSAIMRSLRKAYSSNLIDLPTRVMDKYVNNITQCLETLRTASWYTDAQDGFDKKMSLFPSSAGMSKWSHFMTTTEYSLGNNMFDNSPRTKREIQHSANRKKLAKLIKKVDRSFEYRAGRIRIKPEKKSECAVLELINNTSLDRTVICDAEKQIENKEHYNEFMKIFSKYYKKALGYNDYIRNDGALILVLENYNRIAENHSPEMTFLFLFFLHKISAFANIFESYYSRNRIGELITEHFDVEMIVNQLTDKLSPMLENCNMKLINITTILSDMFTIYVNQETVNRSLIALDESVEKVFGYFIDKLLRNFNTRLKIISGALYADDITTSIEDLITECSGADEKTAVRLKDIFAQHFIDYAIFDFVVKAFYAKMSEDDLLFSDNSDIMRSVHIDLKTGAQLIDNRDGSKMSKNIVKALKYILFNSKKGVR